MVKAYYNIAAKKRGDDLIFLRKIVKGGADDSYGIEVAKLAGVPNEVINRAKRILKSIDNKSLEEFMDIAQVQIDEPQDNQITFASETTESVIKDLKTIDVNNLTPMEAMQRMYELVEKVKHI